MAVDRVDVVAQPDAGIGERERARARPPRRAARRAGPRSPARCAARGRGSRAARSAGGASIQPRDEPVVVVAGDDSSSPSGPSARAERRRRPARRSRRRRAAAPRAARARRRGSRAGRCRASRSSSGARSSGAAQQVGARREPRWRSETTSVRIGRATRLLRRCPTPPAPLDGLLVADFSRVLAGPLRGDDCSATSAPTWSRSSAPDGGDDTRGWGPPWRDGGATYYLGLNRNKRSVALDLADDGDRELARALGERADVLIECFRPGLMDALGPRRRRAARAQPAARVVLGHRVRLRRAAPRAARATTSCCRRWAAS